MGGLSLTQQIYERDVLENSPYTTSSMVKYSLRRFSIWMCRTFIQLNTHLAGLAFQHIRTSIWQNTYLKGLTIGRFVLPWQNTQVLGIWTYRTFIWQNTHLAGLASGRIGLAVWLVELFSTFVDAILAHTSWSPRRFSQIHRLIEGTIPQLFYFVVKLTHTNPTNIHNHLSAFI